MLLPLLQPPGPQKRASQAQPPRGHLAQTAWSLTAYLPHSVPPDTPTQGPPAFHQSCLPWPVGRPSPGIFPEGALVASALQPQGQGGRRPEPAGCLRERSPRGSQRSSQMGGVRRGGRLGPSHGRDQAEACSWEEVRPARGPSPHLWLQGAASPTRPGSSQGLVLPVSGAPLSGKCRTLGGRGPPLPSAAPPRGQVSSRLWLPSARPPGGPTTSLRGEAQSFGRCRRAAFLGPHHCLWPGPPWPLRSPALLPLPASLGPLPLCGHISRVSSARSRPALLCLLGTQWAPPCPAPSLGLWWSGE